MRILVYVLAILLAGVWGWFGPDLLGVPDGSASIIVAGIGGFVIGTNGFVVAERLE